MGASLPEVTRYLNVLRTVHPVGRGQEWRDCLNTALDLYWVLMPHREGVAKDGGV